MTKRKEDDDQGIEELKRFESGSIRQVLDDVRYDLITPIGLKRLAQTYAGGAKKYTDRNWEKGQPYSVLLNHAQDHINDFITQQLGLGDELDISLEDHLAHAVWNLMAIMHFQTTKPEMNDLRPLKEGEITAGKIDAGAVTTTTELSTHEFSGEIAKLCEVCKKPSNHMIHKTTKWSTQGE